MAQVQPQPYEGYKQPYEGYSTQYAYPPVVSAQPQPYHNTVIVQQPGYGQQQQRNWDSGICDCFDDLGICLFGYFCGLCLMCQVASDMGESPCVPCCVPGALITMRTKWRTQHNIRGTIMGDCCDIWCCGPCVMCQLAREVKTYGKTH